MSRKLSKDKKKKINLSQSILKKEKRNTEPTIQTERNNEVSSEDNDLQKLGPTWRSLPRSAIKPSAEPSSNKELTRFRSLYLNYLYFPPTKIQKIKSKLKETTK